MRDKGANMEFVSRYVAKKPDSAGFIKYRDEENHVWQLLYQRQIDIDGRACDEFVCGLKILELTPESIPQLPDVSHRLKKMTGWEIAPVAALILAREFFELLANRKFPAATFI